MAEYNQDDLIGRTFLLPPNQKGERHRASLKQKVIEISKKLGEDQNAMVDNINFLLDVGQGRFQTIISNNQVLNYLEKDNQDDESLYKFRAITDHHGPLKKGDPNYNGSLCNVMVEWEIGEITEEPLSIIVPDDAVTCAAYAKEHNLLHLPKCNKLKHIAKHQKTPTRAINQTKIRQVRRSATYQFGYLIPRGYKHTLEIDKIFGNSRWYGATKKEMDQINEYQVFIDHGIAKCDPKSKWITNSP